MSENEFIKKAQKELSDWQNNNKEFIERMNNINSNAQQLAEDQEMGITYRDGKKQCREFSEKQLAEHCSDNNEIQFTNNVDKSGLYGGIGDEREQAEIDRIEQMAK